MRCWIRSPATAGATSLLSDGTRAVGRGGADAALLEPLAGHESAGTFALRQPATAAAATELAPGLWLWALGRATDFERAAVAGDRSRQRVVWAISIGLAVAVAVVSVRPGPRRRRERNNRNDRRALLLGPAATDLNATRSGIAASGPVTVSSSTATLVRPGPGTALGRYLLVDQIGVGGMAEVYTAVSFGVGRFRRPFVIKRLRAELDGNATAVSLFIDEANLASTLVHPNVVPVFDFGEAGGSYFLAAEYIVGRDLGRVTTRLRDRGDPLLSRNTILYLANEILNGLAYAHDKRDDAGRLLGLVHRDVTPANVIISERGEVKILDFGIMKAKQRVSQTESGTVRGNVGFMSPEQARGRPVDHRSDLFSTGLADPVRGDRRADVSRRHVLRSADGRRVRPERRPEGAHRGVARATAGDPHARARGRPGQAVSVQRRVQRGDRSPSLARWRDRAAAPGSRPCSATSCAPSKTAWPPPSPTPPAPSPSPAPAPEHLPPSPRPRGEGRGEGPAISGGGALGRVPRSATPANTPSTIDPIALIAAQNRRPAMNAVCAARVSSAPSGGVSWPAATTAPPSVARAASAAWTGNTRRQRVAQHHSVYRHADAAEIAMPSAPPNSALVSEIAEAAPARSGGAARRSGRWPA